MIGTVPRIKRCPTELIFSREKLAMHYRIIIKRIPAPHTICNHTSRGYTEAWESINIWTRQIIIHSPLWMQKLKVSEIIILLLLHTIDQTINIIEWTTRNNKNSKYYIFYLLICKTLVNLGSLMPPGIKT